MSDDLLDISSRLGRFLTRIEPGCELIDCTQITAGASQQTFKITAKTANNEQIQYALRREQPNQINRSSGQLTAALEARLLKLASSSGVLVPEIRAELEEADGLGQGYLMAWLEGETLGQRIVKRPEYEAVRQSLAFECGRELAKIHAMSVDEDLAAALNQVSPEVLVRETWSAYQTLGSPQPMIDFTAQWLLSNLPEPAPPTLVHGDFRNGNLMIDESGLVAVLDWELAHIGDPMRDLGWLCVNSWRFGYCSNPVGGFGAVDKLIAGYQSLSTTRVDCSAIEFWQVFGSFWWSVTTLGMAATWRSGETPSLERPVIGRRSSEAQLDCVNLLIPGPASLPDDGVTNSSGDLPEVAELIGGVSRYLSESVAPSSSGAAQFIARVAANSLAIAERETTIGRVLKQAEHARLRDICGDGDLPSLRQQLCTELRAGNLGESKQVADHLRQTAVDRCWVDQPHYSALRVHRGQQTAGSN